MSPNPEACDEELPFREGQLIKVRPYIFLNGKCGGGAVGCGGARWGTASVRRGFL